MLAGAPPPAAQPPAAAAAGAAEQVSSPGEVGAQPAAQQQQQAQPGSSGRKRKAEELSPGKCEPAAAAAAEQQPASGGRSRRAASKKQVVTMEDDDDWDDDSGADDASKGEQAGRQGHCMLQLITQCCCFDRAPQASRSWRSGMGSAHALCSLPARAPVLSQRVLYHSSAGQHPREMQHPCRLCGCWVLPPTSLPHRAPITHCRWRRLGLQPVGPRD